MNCELSIRGNANIRGWCSWELGTFYTINSINKDSKFYINLYSKKDKKIKNKQLDRIKLLSNIIGSVLVWLGVSMNFLEFLKNKCCFIKNINSSSRKMIHIFNQFLITLACYMILNVKNNFINVKNIGSINMLGISLALFPVLAFINEFFINRSEDYFNKHNYYLGYNLKKFELYNNKIIKLFDKIKINKLILTSFIISCLISFSKLEFEYLLFINVKIFIESIERLLYSIWLACIVSYIFYIIMILYVILDFSKDEFYKGYVYDSYNTDIRNKIEKLITKDYEEKLKIIFINSNNIEKDIEDFTRKLFKRASVISNNDEEFENFIHCCYHHEFEVINNISDEYNNIDEYLRRVSKYYLSKWNQIGNIIYFLSNVPDVMLHIASVDYRVIDYIENKYGNVKNISHYFWYCQIFCVNSNL